MRRRRPGDRLPPCRAPGRGRRIRRPPSSAPRTRSCAATAPGRGWSRPIAVRASPHASSSTTSRPVPSSPRRGAWPRARRTGAVQAFRVSGNAQGTPGNGERTGDRKGWEGSRAVAARAAGPCIQRAPGTPWKRRWSARSLLPPAVGRHTADGAINGKRDRRAQLGLLAIFGRHICIGIGLCRVRRSVAACPSNDDEPAPRQPKYGAR